jgi:hypothetical protein
MFGWPRGTHPIRPGSNPPLDTLDRLETTHEDGGRNIGRMPLFFPVAPRSWTSWGIGH